MQPVLLPAAPLFIYTNYFFKDNSVDNEDIDRTRTYLVKVPVRVITCQLVFPRAPTWADPSRGDTVNAELTR